MEIMAAKLPIALLLLAGCEIATDPSLDVTSSRPASPLAYELTSAGSVWLDVAHGSPIRVDHVRIELDATDATTADATQATLTARSSDATAPLAVESDLETLPVVMLDAGQHAAIDLYFPATDAANHAFAWTIASDGRSIAVRGDVAPRADVSLAAGKQWWFSPAYAWPEFRHQDGVITTKPPTGAKVRRAVDESAVSSDSIPTERECDEW